MNAINIKMETVGKEIFIYFTPDSHLAVLPLHIVLGKYSNKYIMDFIGNKGEFFKYQFKLADTPMSRLPEVAHKDILGLDLIMF